jgi:hypothetical protein
MRKVVVIAMLCTACNDFGALTRCAEGLCDAGISPDDGPSDGPTDGVGDGSADGPNLPAAVLIDAGSREDYVDSKGRTWAKDTYLGTARDEDFADRGDIPIAGTNDPRIYQTEHYCMNGFDIPLANGTYVVNLHFAETVTDTIGGRGFDVVVEGRVLRDLDVLQEAGALNTALIKSFDSITVEDGALTLIFMTSIPYGCAEINGIEVLGPIAG